MNIYVKLQCFSSRIMNIKYVKLDYEIAIFQLKNYEYLCKIAMFQSKNKKRKKKKKKSKKNRGEKEEEKKTPAVSKKKDPDVQVE